MENQPSTMQALKQFLKMAACCAGPILGLALLAPLAGGLGVGVSSVVSFLLVLACPLSMLLMIYFMGRGHAGMQGQRPAEEPRLPDVSSPDSVVVRAEGSTQPDGREAFPIPEQIQPWPVPERATVKRQGPGR